MKLTVDVPNTTLEGSYVFVFEGFIIGNELDKVTQYVYLEIYECGDPIFSSNDFDADLSLSIPITYTGIPITNMEVAAIQAQLTSPSCEPAVFLCILPDEPGIPCEKYGLT